MKAEGGVCGVAEMQVDEKGIESTEAFEGLRLTSYQDGGGVWTIGYGHTGPDIASHVTISQAQAERYLRADLVTAVHAVEQDVKVPLTQGEFDALVDFTFNVGSGALQMSTLLRLLNAGEYEAAAAQFARWDHVGAKAVVGLLQRRLVEAAEFRGR